MLFFLYFIYQQESMFHLIARTAKTQQHLSAAVRSMLQWRGLNIFLWLPGEGERRER